ncbi:unnamed protein product [Microthlaspi erraticum]|uniref:Uncharacterized protein n=1 Tax=Microthlaspi erraticum TaxID=1685480 RepID=A0A6D2JWN7_9BRAS|nr:unnamed protein product [Microthlaspi erraticum]
MRPRGPIYRLGGKQVVISLLQEWHLSLVWNQWREDTLQQLGPIISFHDNGTFHCCWCRLLTGLDHSYHLQVAGVVIPLLHPPLSFRGGFRTFPLPEGFVPVVLEN